MSCEVDEYWKAEINEATGEDWKAETTPFEQVHLGINQRITDNPERVKVRSQLHGSTFSDRCNGGLPKWPRRVRECRIRDRGFRPIDIVENTPLDTFLSFLP